MLAAPLVAYGQTDTDIEQKMKDIIVPIIEFRQANATDVLDFLVEATAATAPDKYGIALINTNPPTIRPEGPRRGAAGATAGGGTGAAGGGVITGAV